MYDNDKYIASDCRYHAVMLAMQRMNKKMTSTTPELHPVPVKSPWYHIGIDFVGPITPTSSMAIGTS